VGGGAREPSTVTEMQMPVIGCYQGELGDSVGRMDCQELLLEARVLMGCRERGQGPGRLVGGNWKFGTA
jgi:hypothetical protein